MLLAKIDRVVAPLAVLAVMLTHAPRADAQIDTPAAAEARAALQAVETAYGNRSEWNRWSALLKLPDVRYELHAGDRAEPAALRAAILELLSGRVPQFSEPAFERLAKALDIRAQELAPVRASDWPSACRTAAETYEPIAPEALEAARAELARRLDRFEQQLPTVRLAGDRWGTFLFWPEIRALATPGKPGPAPSGDALDRLEIRWTAAPLVWDDASLFAASLAIRKYIPMLRGYLRGETRDEHAAAWNELADLLLHVGSENADTSKIAAAVTARERLGQASRLTASIRRELSRPNLIVDVQKKWLESQFARRIDEPYQVDGVFGGSRSYGSGRMVGTMQGQILDSRAVGQWLLRTSAVSTARASGGGDRVSVVSRATTRLSASKPFVIDARGVTPLRATAGAVTSIDYESINASGLARRRSAAISETYARRPQAEAESAAYARRSILERINAEADKVAADFNRSYHERLRDPRMNAHRPGAQVRVRSSGETLRWECLLEGPTTFGAPAPPPQFDAGTEIAMSLAASALEEQGTMTLGGRKMTGAQLQETLGPALAKTEAAEGDDFNVAFESDPCDFRIDEGAIHARLYITSFDSADTKYPAMTVDVSYKPEEREGQVVFVRQGRVRVAPRARGEGEAPVISGRQQTLRLAVERKLAKVFTDELVFSNASLPLTGEKETALRLERARVAGPWLQIGMSPEPKS